jgi:DNA-directed RNA polymerase subunit N (RpoN/RPB10)
MKVPLLIILVGAILVILMREVQSIQHVQRQPIIRTSPAKCFSCERQMPTISHPTKCFSCERQMPTVSHPTKCFSCETINPRTWELPGAGTLGRM